MNLKLRRLQNNLNPTAIARISSGILTGFFAIIIGIFTLIGLLPLSFLQIGLISLFLFASAYGIILFFLRSFIYRKIKLIYKNIHTEKVHKVGRLSATNMDNNILNEVENDVATWAKNQTKEIEDLRSMENYRRDFMGDISHELKTPLFNIQGYIHTLLDGAIYDENINIDYLKRAAKNTERLHFIVEGLESIYKLESDSLELNKEEFNILELVKEVMDETEFIANKRKIAFILKNPNHKGFTVRADRESIRQVLSNLLVNSVKYGNKKGKTTIAFYDMDPNVLIEVADNGVGIPRDHLPRIFDRFYRVEKSRARDRGGSGLGLAIVKHIIEAHKQTVHVRSTIEKGSTFGFTLEKG